MQPKRMVSNRGGGTGEEISFPRRGRAGGVDREIENLGHSKQLGDIRNREEEEDASGSNELEKG